jgi:N-methylhydantoinase B/oxoprolinase/acetone carboxylase alpha subunit
VTANPKIERDVVAESQALAAKLDGEAKASKSGTKKREVVAIATKPVESQSDYEKRFYMRDWKHDAPLTEVRHATNTATLEIVDKFVMWVAEHKQTEFKTGDLISIFETCGPSYGDVIRSAMRHLKAVKAVKISNIGSKKRPRYKYTVNEVSPLFAPIFAQPLTVEAPPAITPP